MDKLSKCFEGSKNSSPKMLRKERSVNLAEGHLEKAHQNLFVAKLMSDNKFFDWSITCSYYAMYHATMASLWLIGLYARFHECAIAAFEALYVKDQKVENEYLRYVQMARTLNKKYADSLEYAKAERIKASYGLVEITSPEASKVLSNAREFVAKINELVLEAKGI